MCNGAPIVPGSGGGGGGGGGPGGGKGGNLNVFGKYFENQTRKPIHDNDIFKWKSSEFTYSTTANARGDINPKRCALK